MEKKRIGMKNEIPLLIDVPNDEKIAPIEASYLVAAESGKAAEDCSFDALQRNFLTQMFDAAVLFFTF